MPKIQPVIDQIENVGDSIKLLDYSGGLNTNSSNEILQKNEAIVRQNWGQESRGAIEKVAGFTKKNSSAIDSAAGRGLFRVYQSDGTKKLLAIVNTKLYFSDNDGSSFTQATSGTGLSASAYNSGVNYNDLFFFTNATNNVQHYTPGTDTMAAATDQPTDPCRILLKRADRRLLALVNTTNGSTLYYSKIDPTGAAADDWSATNDAGSIAIDGAKSEPLSGGMTFGAVDIIFKDYAAFRVWGYPNPQAVRMPGSPGCAAPGSVTQGDGFGFHLGHDGVWMYDGNKFIFISEKIQPIIDDIRASKITDAFGIYRDGFYWLFYTLTGETTNKRCIIYDVLNSNPYTGQNIWFERRGLSINSPVLFNGVGDDNELYGISSAADGFVFQLDSSSDGSDNTANIEAIYQTKYFNAGLPHVVKRFPKIHIRYFLNKGNLLINWFTNRGNVSGSFTIAATQTGVTLGTFLLGTDSLAGIIESTHTEKLPDTAVGKDISVKITHSDTGTAPIVRDMEIEYELLYTE